MAADKKLRYPVDEARPWLSPEAGWPQEVPRNVDFPEISLGKMLDNAVAQYADLPAMWFLDTWMSYRQLKGHVDALASALHKLGFRKGDVIALLLPNSFQFVIAYYAVTRIGAIATGCNPTYKPMEILHQLRATGASGLIFLDALYEPIVAPIAGNLTLRSQIATNIADFMPGVKRLLGKLLGKIPTGKVPAEALRFKDLLRTPVDLPAVALDPVADPAIYLMTGGTTGVPKAAVLTHYNCVSNTVQAGLWLYKAQPRTCNLGILPLFHSFAMTCVMNITLHKGGWMMLFPRPPKMDELCQRIVALGPREGTLFAGAEVLFQRMAEFPDLKKYDLQGKLSLCVSGAGPLHRPVQEAFEAATGAKLVEGYGLTEASPVVSAGPFYGNRKIGSIGLPFPGTDWRNVDIATGTKDLPPGKEQVGELIVCGPQVMQGYLNQPEETADTIRTRDGRPWLFTGDLGYFDEQGSYYISDRKKQLIKYKGYSVFPKEVEELVGAHPAVSEVAVAGLPDRDAGEVIKAWVVLHAERRGTLDEQQLLAWCQDNMTHYKVPRHIEFRTELPKTLVGKVLRRELQIADPLWKAAHGEPAAPPPA